MSIITKERLLKSDLREEYFEKQVDELNKILIYHFERGYDSYHASKNNWGDNTDRMLTLLKENGYNVEEDRVENYELWKISW